MKAISTICLLATVFGCLGHAGKVMAGGGGENMLLVVNPNDPDSLQIANAYAALRNIPANNILFITPPTSYHNDGQPLPISEQANVTNTYLAPIAAAITNRHLENQINYIGTIGQILSYSISGVTFTSGNSLNYALSLLTPLTNGSGLTLQNACFNYSNSGTSALYYSTPGTIAIGSNSAILHSTSYSNVYYPVANHNYTTQYYMSGTIGYTGTNGNTVSDVIASLQNGATSDGTRPAGTIYFEDNNDIRSTSRNTEWPTTQQDLTARGIPWVYEKDISGATPLNRSSGTAAVLGAVTGLATLTLPNGSTYLPGSWADNLTSYGCYFPETGQTKATKFIAAGAAGTTGTVLEPYTTSNSPRFTNSSIHTFIADGSTLGEAFAKSVAAPDMQMPLGDMMAQPFADIPKVAFTSSPGNYGSAKGTISISASAGLTNPHIATGISKLELIVDGLVGSYGTLAGSSGTFSLDTTTLPDGVHEVRIVGINNSQAASEGYAAQQIVVNNHGRAINFNGGSLTLTSSATMISLAATAGDGTLSQIELTCLGRTVASGLPGSLSLSPTALAYGDNVLVPVAVFTDGKRVSGGAVTIHRETGIPNNWGNGGNTGLWSNPSNWTSGSLPQNGDKVARFSGPAAGGTVTLDKSASVEEIDFDKIGGGYTLAAFPGQALALSSTNGSGSQCLINVLNGSHTISAPLLLATAGNLVTVTNPADSLTVKGGVSGGGGLTKTGNGLLILAGSNSYTGVTTVSAGTILLNNANAVPNSTVTVSINNGLLFNTSSGTVTTFNVGGLSGSGNIRLADGSYPLTLSAGGNDAGSMYSGILSGSGSLTKVGGGTLVLSGSNTYSGSTTVSAGGLKLDFSQVSAPIANIINNASNTSALVLGGGTLAIQGKANTTNSQWFNGVAVNPGNSAIVLTAGTSNPLLLSLGDISRTPGGTVDFTLSSGTLSGTNGITTSTTNTNDILGGYATVSGTNWAVSNGTAGCITAYNAYTGGNLGTLNSSGTLNVLPTGSQTVIASAKTFNTLNLKGNMRVTIAASLTLAGGGLIGNATPGGQSATINGGTLAGSASGELIVITPTNLAIGSIINDNGGATGLTKAGSGTLTLTGSNTYSGVTTIGSGTLRVGNGGANGTLGTGMVIDNSALVFNLSGTTTFGRVISGVGSLTQASTGILTLIGSNSYSGGTSITGGMLSLGSVGALGTTGTISFGGGILQFTSSNSTDYTNYLRINRFSNAPNQAYNLDTNAQSVTLAGNLTSSGGSLNKLGSGTLILFGSNSYTGGTTVSTGTLQIGNGGTSGSLAGNITDNALLVFNRSDNLTFGGIISGFGSLTQVGTGILTLTGSNTYSGTTTVSAGILQLSSSSAPAISGNLTVSGGTAQLLLSNQIGAAKSVNVSAGLLDIAAFNNTVGGLQLTGGAITGTTGLLTSTTAFDVQSGIISANLGGNIGLNKTTTNTVVLSGSNSYTGSTTISSGVVQFSSPQALGGSGASLLIAPGATVATGYPMNQTFVGRISPSSSLNAFTLALATSSSNALDFSATGANLNLASLGAIGTQTYSGVLTPSGSTYRFGGGGGTLIVASNLTGSSNSLKVTGNVVLSGTNTYGGSTTVSSGVVQFSSSQALGGSGATLSIAPGATVATGYPINQTFVGRISPSSSSSAFTLALATNSSNPLNFSATGTNLTLASLGAIGTQTYSGVLTPSGSTYRLGGGGGTLIVASNLIGPSNSLRVAGNVVLSGTNTYGGSTTISSGVVQFSSSLALGGSGATLSIAPGVTVATGYPINQTFVGRISPSSSSSAFTLALATNSSNPLNFSATGTNLTLASLGAIGTQTYSGVLTPSGSMYRFGGGGGALNVTSSLTGTRSLVVGSMGLGAVVLSGTNTYTGGTTVSSGTLQIASPSALPDGPLTVGSGGVLLFDPSAFLSAPLVAGSLDIRSLSLDSADPAISPSLTVGSSAVYSVSSTVSSQPALNAVPEPDTMLLLLVASGGGLLWHIRRCRPNSARKWLAQK